MWIFLSHTRTHSLARSASLPPSLHPFIHPSLTHSRRDLQEINLSENSIESLRGLEGHLSLQKVDMSSTGIFFFFLLMGADEGGEGQCLGEGGEGQCLGNGGGR